MREQGQCPRLFFLNHGDTDRSVVFQEFIEAYELPARWSLAKLFGDLEDAYDWIQRIAIDETDRELGDAQMLRVADALLRDAVSVSPIVFSEQWVSWPDHRRTWPPVLAVDQTANHSPHRSVKSVTSADPAFVAVTICGRRRPLRIALNVTYP